MPKGKMETHHIEMTGSMASNGVIAEPEGEDLLPSPLLDHQIICLAAIFIREMLGPHEVAVRIKDHRPGLRNFPSLGRDEIIPGFSAAP